MNKKISFLKDTQIGGGPGTNLLYTYKKDIEYLVDADFVNALKKLQGPNIKEVEDINWVNTIHISKAKKILISRSGGMGDILFISVYLKSIKEINPDCEISFWTMPQNHGILALFPEIDYILIKELTYNEVLQYDYIVHFAGFIETNPKAEIINAYDIGKDFFDGIEKSPLESRVKWTVPKYNSNIKIHIGLAFSASSQIRSIAPFLFFDFLRQLDPKKFRITCFVMQAQLKDFQDFKSHIKTYNPQLELYSLVTPDIAELIRTSLIKDPIHVGIGADSGLINLWGFHKVPVIGLFGPFDSKLRLLYYDLAIGLDPITTCPFGKNENGNCFAHNIGACQLAELKQEVHSPCIHLITSVHLLTALNLILDKAKEKYP